MAGRKRGEFELIAKYFAPLAAGVPGALGLKDDAAFLKVPAGQELVAKTDAAVSGVHFLPDDPPDLIARKVLRRNLSDLAAKGAAPRWYLLDATFPRDVADSWIARFARGLARDQKEFGVSLVGGDTKATPGPATFAITLLGLVRATRGVRRSTAEAGDDVFVTGTVGDGALGLLARQGELGFVTTKLRERLIDRYRLPRPRVSVGPRLLGIATAAIDISDGLVGDLGHICETSKLGAVIEEALLPLSPGAKAALAERPQLIRRVLTGGDDYEILFTAPGSAAKALARLAKETGVPITRIGRMRAGKAVTVLDAAGRKRDVGQGGWLHF
jgi:thiamine-monophosphate kinase